jgi:hypothetical protein
MRSLVHRRVGSDQGRVGRRLVGDCAGAQRRGRLSGGVLRWVAVLVSGAVLAVSSPGAVAAVAAGRAAVTRVTVHASPATVHVGSVLLVSGSVSPRTSTPVVVQRLVGKTWRTLAKGSASKGSFTVTVKASGKAALWVLRAVRAATPTVKAGVSGVLHVRVVTAVFACTRRRQAGWRCSGWSGGPGRRWARRS